MTPRLTTELDALPTIRLDASFCGRTYRLIAADLRFMVSALDLGPSGEQSVKLWFESVDTYVYISVQLFWFLRDSGAIEDC